MVKIRLRRMGERKKPVYRVVVIDSRSARDGGNVIAWIGTYNPMRNPAEIKIDEEQAIKWLKNGAQPTESVQRLFNRVGIKLNQDLNDDNDVVAAV